VTRKVVFRPGADEEAQSARAWYEDQSTGLGRQFADAIDQAIERIATNPLALSLPCTLRRAAPASADSRTESTFEYWTIRSP
jgi:hypothetical protein